MLDESMNRWLRELLDRHGAVAGNRPRRAGRRARAYRMSDIIIIVVVTTGVAVITLFLLLRGRLTRVAVDLRQGLSMPT